MNEETENSALEELKRQLKEAQERVILLTGAVQGCEIIINLRKEKESSDEIIADDSSSIKKTTNKTKSKNAK